MARETTYTGNQRTGLDAASSLDSEGIDLALNGQSEGATVTVNEDGSVEISDVGQDKELAQDKFDENLAERLDPGVLAIIADDVIEGVQADLQSRAGFMDNYNKGLDLLGLKIEDVSNNRSQKRSVSRVGHPLLLEAVIKFQALARNELLPAIGPCKVMTVGGSTEAQDELAAGLETDMNFFLTQIDKGYYPDFDRALFALGFGGNIFKKVYHDPLKRYPVSRSIQIEDLIVSEDASDVHNAQRVTHRLFLKDNILKKLQHVGEYVDTPIAPAQPSSDSTKIKQGTIVGVSFNATRAQDQEHELYETYTDLDLTQHGYREKGAKKDLPLPYVVTVDTATRTVLALRRNWKKDDPQFAQRRRIVHYGLIPSFGFLCLGYLHLLGNQTRALRAIWRILIDSGMFSSFPGGMKAKSIRTNTNEIAPSPGEFVDVDIGPFDKIQDGMMLMPYKEPSAIFIQLSEMIGQDSQRMGGVPDISTDEGRTHIPVGTMMAMVEQATQTMSSTHKRIHAAMQEELTLLKEAFSEDPGSLTRLARNPAREAYVEAEFDSVDLVPATDPNIPSQMHRIQQATALIALSQGAPGLYDQQAINRRALKAIGINDWQSIMHQNPAPPPPPPQVMSKMAELSFKKEQLEQDKQDSQRKAMGEAAELQGEQRQQSAEAQAQQADLKLKKDIAEAKELTARLRMVTEAQQSKHEFAGEFALEKLRQHGDTHRAHLDTHRDHTVAHIQGQYGLKAAAMKPKPKPAGAKAKTKSKKK